MWKYITVILIIGFGAVRSNVIPSKVVECECFNSTNTKSQDECRNNVVQCIQHDADRPSSCFVLWSTDNQTGESYVKMKGCFSDSTCSNTECVDTSKPKKMNFCCCTGNMCNSQFKHMPTTTMPPKIDDTIVNVSTSSDRNVYDYVTIGFSLLLISGVAIFVLSFYASKKKTTVYESPEKQPDELEANTILTQHRPINLLELKARGRFGAVWRAQLSPDEVAVKVFPLQEKESWFTEQNIFTLPQMDHASILEFIGVEKHLDKLEYWLITAYHSNGSLCDYLKANTVTWAEMFKIAESMALGLRHLHEEIPASKNGALKPSIAHRDFKSKNVLLKNDLTACIADFGLALVFQPDIPIGDTHGQVGTRRYMAPEVLDGAINFSRDSFLRIDVYACALVLWELASRCTVHDEKTAEYLQPFQSELGSHPTLDAMQEHIVTNKMRPIIPEQWRQHDGLRVMCDTMEDCWDHDPEARLTASCMIERISTILQNSKTDLIIESNIETPKKEPNEFSR